MNHSDKIRNTVYIMKIDATSYLAELIGTFFFILVILVTDGNAYLTGGALALVIILIGAISGGNVNPAVSFAMYLKGMLTPMELVYYIAAQLMGGAGAVFAFKNLRI